MSSHPPIARILRVSGRFLCALPVVMVVACGPPETVPGPGRPVSAPEPAIQPGGASAAAEAAAARLLRDAVDAVQGQAWQTALRASREVIREYPRVPGSAAALRIGARAALEVGLPETTDSLAGRYLGLVPAADERRFAVILLQARARFELDRIEDGVETLLTLPPGASSSAQEQARSAVRDRVSSLDTPSLESLVAGASPDSPVLAPVLVELAVARYFQGDEAGAREYARSALDLTLDSEDQRLAGAVLEGRVAEVLGAPPAMAALLPSEGSPGLQRVAKLIEEGIRLATEEARTRSRFPVELRVMASTGSQDRAILQYRDLEASGAVGVLGPLLDPAVEAVARARRRPVPIVSPTAGTPAADLPAVYSLSGPDPGAARVLARYAVRAGFRTAAVVYPNIAASTAEARAFMQVFQGAGGSILAALPYDSGATYYEDQLLRVAELRPEAVVLPVPAGDLEILAPQVSFFGLDTLNIRVMGTSGWTSQMVLDAVEPRHTDSVVTVAARAPGRGDSAWLAFVDAYERRYRKSLRSTVPALGYDAAGLLLEGLRSGARRPEDLRRALEAIRDYQGATGALSVEDGRVVRRWFPVLIRDRGLEPIDSVGVPPIGPLPPPPPPPDTTAGADTLRIGQGLQAPGPRVAPHGWIPQGATRDLDPSPARVPVRTPRRMRLLLGG